MAHESNQPEPDDLIGSIVASYVAEERMQHLDSPFLPSRARTAEIINLMRRLIFPGFFDQQRLTTTTIHEHVSDLLDQARSVIYEQVRAALRYSEGITGGKEKAAACEHCDVAARKITDAVLASIPELRRMIGTDIAASFSGDPAAVNTDETIFCYPGIAAIFVHRVAHELWKMKVPLLPRMMSEQIHNETGIDIHPGASIDESFFIDHGTGVVFGETTEIGKRVKVYQGVTLGALSTKGGQLWRGRKRHPTIEDDVTIYGGAIILGGETVIGRGSTINGAVFLTHSVPPGHTVTNKAPELRIRAKGSKRQRDAQAASSEQANPDTVVNDPSAV
jgi:serine O-acetyltransferase